MRVLVCCWVLAMGVCASSAWASFPGRDGLLAVQPATGPGLILVDARGRHERRICTDLSRCGMPHAPSWSPDGNAIGFGAPGLGVKLIYPDGSCLNCQMGGATAPAFTADRSLLTVVSTTHTLQEDGIDGLRQAEISAGPVSAAVWSSRGTLATVSAGRVSVGRPGRMRTLGRGRSPSWSPDGSQLAIERNGWVRVIRVATGAVRRLVRGHSPDWSPDGRSVAYIGSGDALSVIAVSGGRPRRLAQVRGVAVAWQPVPARPVIACAAPPGSTLLASSPGSVLTGHIALTGSSAYFGCITADGRERRLASFGPGNVDLRMLIAAAAVGGDHAALAVTTRDDHYGGSSSVVQVYDLRTGLPARGLGGESVGCSGDGFACVAMIDDVVVGINGVSAAHTIMAVECPPVTSTLCPTEQIVASDATGIHTLDSFTGSDDREPAQLTGLSLTGDVLSWLHSGSPRSATLQLPATSP